MNPPDRKPREEDPVRRSLPIGWLVFKGIPAPKRNSRRPPIGERLQGGAWRHRRSSLRRLRDEVKRVARELYQRRRLEERRKADRRCWASARRPKLTLRRRLPWRMLEREVKDVFQWASNEELDERINKAWEVLAELRRTIIFQDSVRELDLPEPGQMNKERILPGVTVACWKGLGLSTRAANALTAAGICDLEQLAKCRDRLSKIPNVGVKTRAEIERVMAEWSPDAATHSEGKAPGEGAASEG